MDETTPEAALTGQQIISYQAELDSISEKIKTTQEFGRCLSQNINMCSQSVGMELAQKEKSTAFCKELKGQEEQNSCAFAVTLINAGEKKDISLCGSLTGTYIGRCKVEMHRAGAIEKKDIKQCDAIKALPTTELTAENVTDAHTQCVMNVVMSNPESTANDCKSIANEQMQEMCSVTIKTRADIPALPSLPNSREQ